MASKRSAGAASARLLAASRRLTASKLAHDLGEESAQTDADGTFALGNEVAFSNDGLIAYRFHSEPPPFGSSVSAHAVRPVSFAIRPLLAIGGVNPLILAAPVIGSGRGGQKVTRLEFSPSANSLLAVIEASPSLSQHRSAAARLGQVCVWSRGSNSHAMNEQWYLAGHWILSEDQGSHVGSSVVAAHWLPVEGGRNSQLIKRRMDPTKQDVNAIAPQLPGDLKGKGRRKEPFQLLSSIAGGPVMTRRGTCEPEGLVLIGNNGSANLFTRGSSLYESESSGSNETYEALLALLKRPSIATSPLSLPNLATDDMILAAAIHPIRSHSALLVAFTCTKTPDDVQLTELHIAFDLDQPTMVSKPMQPLRLSRQDIGPCHVEQLIFSTTWHASPSAKHNRGGEKVHLIVASSSEPFSSTSTPSMYGRHSVRLSTLLISQHDKTVGQSTLSNAFSSLSSRKEEVPQIFNSSQWHILNEKSRTIFDRSLRHLRACRPIWTSDIIASRPMCSWKEPSGRLTWSTLAAESLTETASFLGAAAREGFSMSPNGGLQVCATTGTLSISILPHGNAAASDTNDIICHLVDSLGEGLGTGRNVDDLLLGHAKFLGRQDVRRKVLIDLALGFGIKNDALTIERPRTLMVLERLFELQKTICVIVQVQGVSTSSKSEVGRAQQESKQAEWALTILHAYKTMLAASVISKGSDVSPKGSTATRGWDLKSLVSVIPCVRLLIEEGEHVIREALLSRLYQDRCPDQETANTMMPGSPLPFLGNGMLRALFVEALQLCISLRSWLGEHANKDAKESINLSQAAAVVIEVNARKQVALIDEKPLVVNGFAVESSTQRAVSVGATLDLVGAAINEIWDQSAIRPEELTRLLRDFQAPSSDKSEHDGDDPSWPFIPTSSERYLSIVQLLTAHLLGQRESLLKDDGLSLFITAEDFSQRSTAHEDELSEWEEEDTTGLNGERNPLSWLKGPRKRLPQRDAISFSPLSNDCRVLNSRKRRRNVLDKKCQTTLNLQSITGHQPLVQSDSAIIAEVLQLPSRVERYWSRLNGPKGWWATE